VRCQIFPGDFARQSDQEEDEAGDAARAVLRARRAVGGAVPPDEGPSQEWSEGVLDGAAPVSKIPGLRSMDGLGAGADWPRLSGAWGRLGRGVALREASGKPAGRRRRRLGLFTVRPF
jgi:hypothetical protein